MGLEVAGVFSLHVGRRTTIIGFSCQIFINFVCSSTIILIFVNCSKRNNSYIERFKLRFSLYILTKNTQLWIQIINLKQTFRKIPLDIF